MKDRGRVKDWYLETVGFDGFDYIHWLARELSGGLSNFSGTVTSVRSEFNEWHSSAL